MANIIKDKELHRIVMTAIIYNEEGKFLVTKRSMNQKAFPGKWTVPGGGLEPDDYINTPKNKDGLWYFVMEQALHREVKEEVGLEIEKPKYLLDLVFIRPDGIPTIVISYYAKYKSGEIKLEEGETADTEHNWVTADEAKQLDMITGIAKEIAMVNQILNGNKNPEFKYV